VEASVQRAIPRAAQIRVIGDGTPGNRLVLTDSAGTELLAFRRHLPYPVDLAALRRGRWQLRSSLDGLPPTADSVYVTFADSTFESTAGCFRVTGQYRVERDNFTVPAMGADYDACPPGERDLPRAIPITGGKLAVSPDTLRLYEENGRETLFTRPR
jgi:heat shock protein HslJ